MTKDNINQLIEDIESQGFNYVLGIIKPGKENDNLEIYTNAGHEPLEKLLKVLKDYKKTRDAKNVDKNQK